MDLLDQPFCLDPIQLGQVGIQHDLLAPDEKDPGCDGFDGNMRMGFGHRLLKNGGAIEN